MFPSTLHWVHLAISQTVFDFVILGKYNKVKNKNVPELGKRIVDMQNSVGYLSKITDKLV